MRISAINTYNTNRLTAPKKDKTQRTSAPSFGIGYSGTAKKAGSELYNFIEHVFLEYRGLPKSGFRTSILKNLMTAPIEEARSAFITLLKNPIIKSTKTEAGNFLHTFSDGLELLTKYENKTNPGIIRANGKFLSEITEDGIYKYAQDGLISMAQRTEDGGVVFKAQFEGSEVPNLIAALDGEGNYTLKRLGANGKYI